MISIKVLHCALPKVAPARIAIWLDTGTRAALVLETAFAGSSREAVV
ncbi:MAG: hypothetical protein ABJH07_06865 [Sedimentitalea sp.]